MFYQLLNLNAISSRIKFAFIILILTNFKVLMCICPTVSVNIYVTRNDDSWQCNSHVVIHDGPISKCSRMIMWRSSKRLIINCIQFVIRCGRSNFDADNLDDISDYDIPNVPGNIAIIIPVAAMLRKVCFFKKFILIIETNSCIAI